MLTPNDLWSLEEYEKERPAFRKKVMEYKKSRQFSLHKNARLYFENELTIKYQVLEMLRIERITDPKGIQDELDTYIPLVPNGHNWKATLMLEFEDEDTRKDQLAKLIGVEDKVWLQVEGHSKVFPVCDEDLVRDTDEKTSSVHFLRFELTSEMVKAAKDGKPLFAGIDYPAMNIPSTAIPDLISQSLVDDLSL